MKKLLLIAFVFVMGATCVMAQSMSESQIVKFIQKEQKAGTSQAQIVTKLMQKGVSVQKIQELRKKYQNAKKNNSTLGSRSNEVSEDIDRSRKDNGTSMRGGSKNKYYRDKGDKETIDEEEMEAQDNTMGLKERKKTKRKRVNGYKEYTEDEEFQMRDALDDFMPDEDDEYYYYKKNKKKKVFGRDIFNNEDLTFEPNMNIATPQNYVLGPGDAVYVDVYGASQKTVESTISPDGYITIDGFGPIHLSGLTVSQAKAHLRSTLGSRYASSRIALTVGQTRTIMINVMGEVKAPGTYTLSAFASVFHALYMAGGTNDIGTLRNIKVYRGGHLVSNVDIYDYILNGKLTGNVRLADNDVIVVGPYDCLVNVTGKVKRPMYYEMKKNESIGSLLKYTGGFTGDAYTKSVRVVRKTGKEYSVFNVGEFDFSSFHVADGDSVSVDSIIKRYENMVELKGGVFRPGMYQLSGDNVTLRGLIESADGIKENAIAQHVVIHRMRENRSLEAFAVDLKGIMEGRVADVPLKNEDVIFVPSEEERLEEQTLKIDGEVFYPGKYQYASGMTVEDFILTAGGLKDGASKQKVIVSRRVLEKNADGTDMAVRSVDYEINLKEGFALDGMAGFTLEPYDEVHVGKAAGFMEQGTIKVDGEVLNRGSFSLNKKVTRLSDVIKMAGGFTKDAYVHGARLIRKMNEEELALREKVILDSRIMSAQMITGNSPSVNVQNRNMVDSLLRERYLNVEEYSVGIELDKAMKKPGSDYDLVLRDGDRLEVPTYNNQVLVWGEVNSPRALRYEDGLSVKDCIYHAGGYTGFAWKRHAYVKYSNGMVKSMRHGADIEPGCEVIVPVRSVRTDQMSTQTLVSMLSSLSTVAAVVIAAVK